MGMLHFMYSRSLVFQEIPDEIGASAGFMPISFNMSF